jgi:hypothetical protein
MVENPSRKRLLTCHRCEQESNTETIIKDKGWKGVRRIHLDQYKPLAGCCDHTNNLQVPQMKNLLDYLKNISFLTLSVSQCC